MTRLIEIKKKQLEQLIETSNNIEHNVQIHLKYHGNEFYIYILFPWPLNAFVKRKKANTYSK